MKRKIFLGQYTWTLGYAEECLEFESFLSQLKLKTIKIRELKEGINSTLMILIFMLSVFELVIMMMMMMMMI